MVVAAAPTHRVAVPHNLVAIPLPPLFILLLLLLPLPLLLLLAIVAAAAAAWFLGGLALSTSHHLFPKLCRCVVDLRECNTGRG